VTYTVKIGRKSYRSRLYARNKRGRFKASLTLPTRARRAKRGTVELKFRGDAAFSAQTVRRSVVAR
jgi:hypothetical protein